MGKALATIVIPIHLEEPSELEKVSLDQTLAILHKYPITFMAPVGLNTAWYEAYCQGKAVIHIARFVWKGHEAFGELLLAPNFFEAFLHYEYILICHLDAFVFRDDLEKWCQLGYDYVGAVIYNTLWGSIDTPLRRLTGLSFPEYLGNGGFALKKVDTFYRITSKFKPYINFYHWVRKLRKKGLLEDLFVAQHFPRLSSNFSMPPKDVAQQFGAAYEDWEEAELPFNNKQISSLPFGIHGWIQSYPDYWKVSIRQYGHNV